MCVCVWSFHVHSAFATAAWKQVLRQIIVSELPIANPYPAIPPYILSRMAHPLFSVFLFGYTKFLTALKCFGGIIYHLKGVI